MKTTFQKYLVFPVLFSFILILIFSSCQKDPLIEIENTQVEINNYNDQAGLRNKIPSGDGVTVLGEKREIPYAVKHISAAMKAIYGSKAITPDPTHLYIRMRAINKKQFEILHELDLDWEEQPIEYEVSYQGERYEDPTISKEEMQWLYATVPADFSFPEVTYEIIEQLVITPYQSHLTFKAFQLSGNEDVYEGFTSGDCTPDCLNYPYCLENGGPCLSSGGELSDCTTDCLNYPCCLLEEYGCDDQLCDGFDCFPGAPGWPECNNPSSGNYSSCGCSFETAGYSRPRGQVKVEDTVLDNPGTAGQGVRRVQVQAKSDRWFSFIWHSGDTDDNGCFVIDHNFSSHGIRARVKFKSPYCTIKAWQKTAFIFAYKSKTKTYDGPNYSNLCINLIRGGDNTIQTRDWQAATVANSVAEFHDYELQLPLDLRIWIDRNRDGAPMLGSAGQQQALCLDEIVLGDGNIGEYYNFLQQLVGNVAHASVDIFAGWIAPDIVLEDEDDSDWFKATIYHELAHASHYALAGECYWRKVRAHETFMWSATNADPNQQADPYGDPTNMPFPPPPYTNFPIVALAESWGEHIGVLYTTRKYPNTPISNAEFLTWEQLLEFRLSVENNFIPEGLHWDLIDGINSSDGSTVNGGILVNDQAEGATLLELYSLLDNDINDFRDAVLNLNSVSGDVSGLFNEYGY